MNINIYHGSYNRVSRTTAIKYIVIHYTGSGTSKAGSAKANCIYFSRANRNASAHYFIDDSGIWEYAEPKTYVTWHVGDGHGKYGITNQNSIGIEVCSSGADFTSSEKSYLRELVTYLMSKFGIDSNHVVRHYDASRKCCPYPYCPTGSDKTGTKWNTLKTYITGGSNANINTTSTSEAKSNTSTKSYKSIKLDVDNVWAGDTTIGKWQELIGTPADGVITGQDPTNKKYTPNIASITYEYGGSKLVTEIQKQSRYLDTDGYLGPKTVKYIQRYLGVDDDGYFGPNTVKALKNRLNTGKW